MRDGDLRSLFIAGEYKGYGLAIFSYYGRRCEMGICDL